MLPRILANDDHYIDRFEKISSSVSQYNGNNHRRNVVFLKYSSDNKHRRQLSTQDLLHVLGAPCAEVQSREVTWDSADTNLSHIPNIGAKGTCVSGFTPRSPYPLPGLYWIKGWSRHCCLETTLSWSIA